MPVPLAFAEDSISAVMVAAYAVSAGIAVRMIIFEVSNFFKIEMKKIVTENYKINEGRGLFSLTGAF